MGPHPTFSWDWLDIEIHSLVEVVTITTPLSRLISVKMSRIILISHFICYTLSAWAGHQDSSSFHFDVPTDL